MTIRGRTFPEPELEDDRVFWQRDPSEPSVVACSDAQHRVTNDAGSIAGLTGLRIVDEPTNAPIAYGFDKKSSRDAD